MLNATQNQETDTSVCAVLPPISDDNRDKKSVKSAWYDATSEQLLNSRIAIIDDEELNIEVVEGYLEQDGYHNVIRSTDPRQAIELFRTYRPDIVLLDVMMPNISGLEILATMKNDPELSEIAVIILTACTDSETKRQALKTKAADFLAKPVDPSELLLRLKNVLTAKLFEDHLADYSLELEHRVQMRTQELIDSRHRIIHCLARAAEFRDDDTGHHVIRVGKYAGVVARQLGFDGERVDLIEHAAQLHDIGKIGVPDSILLKEGKLEPEEFDVVRRHCSFGSSIINPMSAQEYQAYKEHAKIGADLLEYDGFPVMELAGVIAQTHHEKWDGSGYPLGLVGEDIPIEGRITAVADVFDALSTKRPYKPAFPREKCFQILEEGRGTHFDPKVLDAFFASSAEIIAIQIRHADVEPMKSSE